MLQNRPIFPCGPDKSPLVSRGFYAANTKQSIIDRWKRKFNPPLWGSPTGDGYFVVDVDDAGALEALEKLTGKLPETLTAKTPRGIHLYFKQPEHIEIRNRQNVVPKIDVRGKGGYVIVWPFVNSDAPIAEAPEELIQLVKPRDH